MTPRIKGVRSCRPEPGRFWIRYLPAVWPAAEGLWVDLGRRALGTGGTGAGGEVPSLDLEALDDVLYLPPQRPEAAPATAALIERLTAASIPLVRQWPARGSEPVPDGEGVVLDLLSLLLEEGAGGLAKLRTSCTLAVWPLIAGLTDDADLWQPGLEALAACGVETVVPQVLELDPASRRRLAVYADETGYQALFHGGPPESRAFVRTALTLGLSILPSRPELGAPPRFAFRRLAATELIVVADLWLRLGRSEAAGQELLRAARWAEGFEHDLRSIALEGNLGVVPWLGEAARQVVTDLAGAAEGGAGSSLRRELETELQEAS